MIEKGRLGYGYGIQGRTRKARRQCKRYGYDLSEIWNLDSTVMRWLSDNVGGVFTDMLSEIHKMDSEPEYFKAHLREWLKDKDNLKRFSEFTVPRLKIFKSKILGTPNILTEQQWKDIVQEMIDTFENGSVSESFFKYFYYL